MDTSPAPAQASVVELRAHFKRADDPVSLDLDTVDRIYIFLLNLLSAARRDRNEQDLVLFNKLGEIASSHEHIAFSREEARRIQGIININPALDRIPLSSAKILSCFLRAKSGLGYIADTPTFVNLRTLNALGLSTFLFNFIMQRDCPIQYLLTTPFKHPLVETLKSGERSDMPGAFIAAGSTEKLYPHPETIDWVIPTRPALG